jgi:hypothetical protein
MAILVLRCQTDLVEVRRVGRVLPAEFFSFGRPCAACEISLQNRSISDCNSLLGLPIVKLSTGLNDLLTRLAE